MTKNLHKYRNEIIITVGLWLVGFIILIIDDLSAINLFLMTVIVTIFGYILKQSSTIARLEEKVDFVYNYIVEEINKKIKR